MPHMEYPIPWTSPAVSSLPKGDREFLSRIFSGGLTRYRDRLQNIRFDKLGRVLDAGAGFGQWALALESLGNTVYPLDVSMQRNRFLAEIVRTNEVQRVYGARASLETLPYQDNVFDGVFSFSSIYFLRYQLAINEFSRVLRPGGLLYINVNDIGWYLYLLFSGHNSTQGYNPRRYAVRSIVNTVLRTGPPYSEQGGSQYIPQKTIIQLLTKRGFDILARGGDGLIDVSGQGSVCPLLPARFWGLNAVYEILARKQG